MCRILLLIALLLPGFCKSQLSFSTQQIELGAIAEAYEIKGDVVIKNNAAKKIFLMRADADKGVKIYTSKKTLLPGDTCLLVISFIPESNGKFKKKISLVATDKETPYDLSLAGSVAKVKTDDKTACYYFGNQRSNSVPVKDIPAIADHKTDQRDNSNKIPDHATAPIETFSAPVKTAEPANEKNPNELSVAEYKPNNILFLVDVSGSMKDSLKLPLMKNALHALIDAVRDIDRITFVTYADSVKIIREAIKGSDKKTLHEATDALKAKGLTKGNKAILFSQQLAQKHFISGGNNQILLATDGKFKFNSNDFNTWTERQADGKIVMSTVAFGEDREALTNLKDIAEQGQGSFIHIKKRNGSRDKLLDEIRQRSKIQ